MYQSLPVTQTQPDRAEYGISNLFLFRRFASREDFKAVTGTDAPPFDPNRDLKYWMDSTAAGKSKFAGMSYIMAVQNGAGAPTVEPLVLTASIAATVNLPDNTAYPNVGPDEVPVPIRSLLANEELYFDAFGQIMVRRTDAVDNDPTEFTAADRAMLRKIAQKLGVA